MYAIKRWSPRDNPKRAIWYVAEDGICVYEARNKREAERYMDWLLNRLRK